MNIYVSELRFFPLAYETTMCVHSGMLYSVCAWQTGYCTLLYNRDMYVSVLCTCTYRYYIQKAAT